MDDEVYSTILLACETVLAEKDKRSQMAAIGIESAIGIFRQLSELFPDKLTDISSHLEEWRIGRSLNDDLFEFYSYRDKKWPDLFCRIMSVRTFSGMLQHHINDFGKAPKGDYFLTFIEEIAAMSYWKSHGKEISEDEFIYIFCVLERTLFHSADLKAKLYSSVESFEKNMNFNMFLLPVY